MNWNKGYSASFYATEVDPYTWRDIARIEIISGSVSRSGDNLRESADLLCRDFDSQGEKWVRVYMNTMQAGRASHTPIFTGLAVSPEQNIDGKVIEYPLSCYSVLQPCADVLLDRGWYAPAEINGATMIRRLLSVTPAPVEIVGDSPSLTKAIIAENNESNLSMAVKILNVIGWRMRVKGDGSIQICPKATEPTTSFDSVENDSIEPKVKKTRDWFKCPNVFRAIQGDITAIARDDSPTSPLSTVNRGREVWKQESVSSLNSGEGISGYARRRLKEEQQQGLSISYDRRYYPNLLVDDIVTLNYPKQGIVGNYRITSQSIELGYSAKTSEEVVSV